MQIAVIEFARNVAGIPQANSSEFNELTADPVIYLMTEWFDERTRSVQRRDSSSDKGATMRLGAYPCRLSAGSLAHRAYGAEDISERHRHRFEFNNAYLKRFEEKGLVFSGMSPTGDLVEIVELRDHPWFLGCQFHPEFKSRPMAPAPALPRVHPGGAGLPASSARSAAEGDPGFRPPDGSRLPVCACLDRNPKPGSRTVNRLNR